jgi:hypothetical protein
MLGTMLYVDIEIPVFPTIVGTATFLSYEEKNDIDDSMFAIPTAQDGYVIVV